MAIETAVLTPAQYLAEERRREEKYEYEDGKLIQKGGASKIHNRITRNILAFLWNILRQQGGYEAYSTDLRVHTPLEEKYFYPDIVVSQGEEQFLDDELDTLLNPLILIEVLSPFTEARDRGVKFEAYRSIPSLQEYLLVSQDAYRIEGYYRTEEGQWVIAEPVHGVENSYNFRSIELELPLSEAYFKVKR